jgi:hypothetical protein
VAVVGQEQVGRLQVAVDQPVGAGVLECLGRLVGVVRRDGRGQAALAPQGAFQVGALDALAEQGVAAAVGLTGGGLDDAGWETLASARAARGKRATALARRRSSSWVMVLSVQFSSRPPTPSLIPVLESTFAKAGPFG